MPPLKYGKLLSLARFLSRFSALSCLILQCFEGESCGICHIFLTFHYAENAFLLVVTLQRFGLLMIGFKPVEYRLGHIVLSLDELFAADVANAFCLWLFVLGMISCTSLEADSSA